MESDFEHTVAYWVNKGLELNACQQKKTYLVSSSRIGLSKWGWKQFEVKFKRSGAKYEPGVKWSQVFFFVGFRHDVIESNKLHAIQIVCFLCVFSTDLEGSQVLNLSLEDFIQAL